MIASGCLLPPPVVVDADDNTPVSFNQELTFPLKSAVTINQTCSQCEFTLTLDDPDVDDVYVRGFIDYDLERSPAICFPTSVDSGNPRAPRTQLACTFTLGKYRDPRYEGTSHAIEVWVTDRQWQFPTDGTSRARSDGATYALQRWTVTFERRGVTCDDREGMKCRDSAP